MSSSPDPAPNPKNNDALKQKVAFRLDALSYAQSTLAGKLFALTTQEPTQQLALIDLVASSQKTAEQVLYIAEASDIRGLMIGRLASVAKEQHADARFAQLLEAILHMKNVKLGSEFQSQIIGTLIAATVECWPAHSGSSAIEFNDILAFGLMLAEAYSQGLLVKGDIPNPKDLRLVSIIVERTSANPIREFIELKKCTLPSGDSINSVNDLNKYYDYHRFIIAASERSTTCFEFPTDEGTERITLREIGRAFASTASPLSISCSNLLVDRLMSLKLPKDLEGLIAYTIATARLSDRDVSAVLDLTQNLAKIIALEPDSGARLGQDAREILSELWLHSNPPQTKRRGLRLLGEILKDREQWKHIKVLMDFKGGDDLTPIERAIYSSKLRAFARSNPDRPVGEIVSQLRAADSNGLNAPDESIILQTALIVNRVLSVDPHAPASAPTTVRKSGSLDVSDEVWISYCVWARAWCQEFFGFAPNTSQLFAVIMGAKQMQQSSVSGGSGAWIELATGEGKSLVLALMAGFQTLVGNSATVTAPNNYLAERDARLFAPLFEALGSRTVSLRDLETTAILQQRKFVLYTTVKEIIYSWIHSNSKGAMPLGGAKLDTILLDEVDALLIDHGTQQHWLTDGSNISTPAETEAADKYWNMLFKHRSELSDDALASAAYLAEIEPNIFGSTDPILLSFHAASAVATDRLKFGVSYVVQDRAIVPIDRTETQRLLSNTVLIHGLHQLLATKRNLPRTVRGRIIGSGTPYDVVELYRNVFCCSGTIGNQSERSELQRVYGLVGSHIPVNNTSIRVDEPLKLFRNDRELTAAIWSKLREVHATGRPILLVADSIRQALRLRKLAPGPHQILTDFENRTREGKASEDDIIDQAGRAGAITIATSMVGRGTDIKLDDDALAAGGLFVLICGIPELERGEAQIRRRAARQGQPGGSIVYASIESDFYLSGLPRAVCDIFAKEVASAEYRPGCEKFQRMLEFVRGARTLIKSAKRELMVNYKNEIREGINRYLAHNRYTMGEPWTNDLLMFPAQVAGLVVNHQIRDGKLRTDDNFEQLATPEFAELQRLFTQSFGQSAPIFEGAANYDLQSEQLYRIYSNILTVMLKSEQLLSADNICAELLKYRDSFQAAVAASKRLRLADWGTSSG